MKKIITVLLAAMLLALAACGNFAGQKQDASPDLELENTPAAQPSIDEPALPEEESEPVSESETAAESAPETKNGGVLVVYYSASGNTETVAGYIANAAGGDMFAIVPEEPYTSDDLNWTDPDSRVSREHDDPVLRTMELETATVENWDSYDTVFIGYPIWWGIAAWPVDNFVAANDFTGKAVIPFCTSSSSGLGESGELLAELAGTGDWQEGQRFRGSASESDVVEWVNRLNIQ